MSTDSTQRFSDRVEAYLAGRPRYPTAAVAYLRARGALHDGSVVADVGVGTGLSAEVFLAAGCTVVGIEPNAPMRAAGVEYLAAYPAYSVRDGTAEATGLEARSVDMVIAAQAFHWFDPARFRAEALRILRPGGWAALIWNDRDTRGTPFLSGYEELLLEFGNDYRAIRYRHEGTEAIPVFFGGQAPAAAEFPHQRQLDWTALAALAGSASYLPGPGAPNHAALMSALRALFDAHAADGRVVMRYTCRVHAAPLD
jgi:SAM-dependent methyltransferase